MKFQRLTPRRISKGRSLIWLAIMSIIVIGLIVYLSRIARGY